MILSVLGSLLTTSQQDRDYQDSLLVEPVSCCCTVVDFTACFNRLDNDIHLTFRRLGITRKQLVSSIVHSALVAPPSLAW